MVGAELKPALSGSLYVGQNAERVYTVLKHPLAIGVTNDYFHEAGHTIRLMLGEKLKR
mgnify:CR=1 FL=1